MKQPPYEILASTTDISREEWLELRRTGIGGSEAAAIVGLHKYTTPSEVFLDKLGQLPEKEQNDYMLVGSCMEEGVLKVFQKKTGIEAIPFKVMVRSREYPWMLANIDASCKVGEEYGVVEVKMPASLDGWKDDSVPDYAHLQLMHYLAVLGWSFGYITAVLPGHKPFYKLIQRDEEVIRYLVEKEREFWQCVEKKEMPALQFNSSLVKAAFPKATEPTIVLDSELAEHCRLIKQFKNAEKGIAQLREELETELKVALGAHCGGVVMSEVGNFEVRWANRNRRALNTALVKERFPEVAEVCTEDSSSRYFDIVEVKEDGKKQRRIDATDGIIDLAKYRAIRKRSVSDLAERTAGLQGRTVAGALAGIGGITENLRVLCNNSTPVEAGAVALRPAEPCVLDFLSDESSGMGSGLQSAERSLPDSSRREEAGDSVEDWLQRMDEVGKKLGGGE